MDRLVELALELLQTTHSLRECVNSGELTDIESIQQQREELIRNLDHESRRQEHDEDTLRQVRTLVEQSRQIEADTITLLEQKRDAIGQEYNQLLTSKKARKAYRGL